MLRKAVPAVDDSLTEEVTPQVQSTSIFGDLDCVSSCSCNTAERKHAAEAYSGQPFVHSKDFQQIGTVSSLFQGPQAEGP